MKYHNYNESERRPKFIVIWILIISSTIAITYQLIKTLI